MVHFVNMLKNLSTWGKIILPLKSIRYYPPQFTMRDPVAQGVRKAFKQGFEVAVVVFYIRNLRELERALGELSFHRYRKTVKTRFSQTIKEKVADEEMLLLHDFYSDGLTLFLKIDHNNSSVSEIEATMKHILEESEKKINHDITSRNPVFEAGYMFIDKNSFSIQDAISRAHQHALAMAEKQVKSEFNEMIYAIRKIVTQKEINLLAQPIIDVATKEIRAWEMLSRGPRNTPYENPLHLFSIARQTGMLYELERIVLEKTLEQIRLTGCKQDIYINFTPISLGNESFMEDVKEIMESYLEIPPTQITIEITERDSIEGITHLIQNIKALRNLGFRFAVDDTGSGYASLNTISTIMPDIIKVDRSVIQDIDKNSVKESMLKGLLLVAKETGSLVVAEGIESEEEASVLCRNRVDLAQGYFFARPGLLPSL